MSIRKKISKIIDKNVVAWGGELEDINEDKSAKEIIQLLIDELPEIPDHHSSEQFLQFIGAEDYRRELLNKLK